MPDTELISTLIVFKTNNTTATVFTSCLKDLLRNIYWAFLSIVLSEVEHKNLKLFEGDSPSS